MPNKDFEYWFDEWPKGFPFLNRLGILIQSLETVGVFPTTDASAEDSVTPKMLIFWCSIVSPLIKLAKITLSMKYRLKGKKNRVIQLTR